MPPTRCRSVCSGFNLVSELTQQVTIMRMEAENTHDRRVRSQLEGVITTVEGVMDAVNLAGSEVSSGYFGAQPHTQMKRQDHNTPHNTID